MPLKNYHIQREDYARSLKFTFPLDLTGCKVIMTAKEPKRMNEADDTNVIFKKVVTVFASTSPTESVCVIDFDDPDLEKPGSYQYDLVLVNAAGKPKTYLYGTFTIDNHATREFN
jgi:hypothetical protein